MPNYPNQHRADLEAATLEEELRFVLAEAKAGKPVHINGHTNAPRQFTVAFEAAPDAERLRAAFDEVVISGKVADLTLRDATKAAAAEAAPTARESEVEADDFNPAI